MVRTKTDTSKNLKPCRTTEEARERGRKGGIKSAESKKKKKTLKDIANFLLDMKAPEEFIAKIENLCPELKSEDMTNRLLIMQRQILNALAGDNKSFELIRDTIGEKPININQVTGKDGESLIQKVYVTPEDLKKTDEHIDEVIGGNR